MKTQEIEKFNRDLIDLISVDLKHRRLLNRENISREINVLVNDFIKEYSNSDSDEALEIYAIFYEDLSDLLTLGNSLKPVSGLGKIIDIFLNDININKSTIIYPPD